MDQRLYQVSLTYIRRWPLWLIAIGYMAACAIAMQFAWSTFGANRSVAPQPTFRGWKARVEIDEETRSTYWNIDTHPGHFAGITTNSPALQSFQISGTLISESELRVLRFMPNLTDLLIDGRLTPNALDPLVQLPQLRYLHLQMTDGQLDLLPLKRLIQRNRPPQPFLTVTVG